MSRGYAQFRPGPALDAAPCCTQARWASAPVASVPLPRAQRQGSFPTPDPSGAFWKMLAVQINLNAPQAAPGGSGGSQRRDGNGLGTLDSRLQDGAQGLTSLEGRSELSPPWRSELKGRLCGRKAIRGGRKVQENRCFRWA